METSGDFDGTVAKGHWSIVPALGHRRAQRHIGRGQLRGATTARREVQLDYAFSESFVEH